MEPGNLDNITKRTSREIPKNSDLGSFDDNHCLISDGVKYNVGFLIKKSEGLPIINMSLAELTHALNDECWDDISGKKLRPREVIDLIGNFPETDEQWQQLEQTHPNLGEHFKRIRNANNSSPILILSIDSELVVIDGLHRLARTFMENKSDIKVRKFDKLPLNTDTETK